MSNTDGNTGTLYDWGSNLAEAEALKERIAEANEVLEEERAVARANYDEAIKNIEAKRANIAIEETARFTELVTRLRGLKAMNVIPEDVEIPQAPRVKGQRERTGDTQRVKSFFAEHPGQSFLSREIAEQIGDVRNLANILSQLKTAGFVKAVDAPSGGRAKNWSLA